MSPVWQAIAHQLLGIESGLSPQRNFSKIRLPSLHPLLKKLLSCLENLVRKANVFSEFNTQSVFVSPPLPHEKFFW